MRALYDRCQDVRRTGCASLELCDVACGRLEGYVELVLQPWDYAAGMRIAAEAGGKVTTLDGSPLSLREGGPLLASNGRLHSALQAILKE
nr:inositol monophosphatase family protein [uncultured Oscillibacter sp.]